MSGFCLSVQRSCFFIRQTVILALMKAPLLLCIAPRHVCWFNVRSVTRSCSVTSTSRGFMVNPLLGVTMCHPQISYRVVTSFWGELDCLWGLHLNFQKKRCSHSTASVRAEINLSWKAKEPQLIVFMRLKYKTEQTKKASNLAYFVVGNVLRSRLISSANCNMVIRCRI